MEYLYENYKNYIYKVESTHDLFKVADNRYLLFNPSIFKWFSMDDIGYEIFHEVKESHDIKIVKEHIMKKYGISEEIYEQDADPFIDKLYNEKYFTDTVKTEGTLEAPWMKKPYGNNKIETYIFNDIYISLSEECNLNCKYCFNKERRGDRKGDKCIDIDKIKDTLEEYKKIGGKGVVFTGGEPTINANFIQICKTAKIIGLRVAVITNGTLLEKYRIEDIVTYIDELSISIDSVEDNIQQELWNVKNYSYTIDVKKNLQKLNEYVKEKEVSFTINIMPVVTKKNIDGLGKLLHEVNKMLDSCKTMWMISQYGKIESEEINNLLGVQEKEFDKAIWYAMNGKVDSKTLAEYILSRGGKEFLVNKPHLTMCSPAFFVTFFGDIYPCQGLESEQYRLGNIMEQDLETIFYSEKFQEILEKLNVNNTEHCALCEFRMYCVNDTDKLCNKEKKENCKKDVIFRMYMSTVGACDGKEYYIRD